jgi:hypothetical protein
MPNRRFPEPVWLQITFLLILVAGTCLALLLLIRASR